MENVRAPNILKKIQKLLSLLQISFKNNKNLMTLKKKMFSTFVKLGKRLKKK
jgi:hypothetical protein